MLVAERLITPKQLIVLLGSAGQLLTNLSELFACLALACCRHLGAGIQACELVFEVVALALQRGDSGLRRAQTIAQVGDLLVQRSAIGLRGFEALGGFVMLPIGVLKF